MVARFKLILSVGGDKWIICSIKTGEHHYRDKCLTTGATCSIILIKMFKGNAVEIFSLLEPRLAKAGWLLPPEPFFNNKYYSRYLHLLFDSMMTLYSTSCCSVIQQFREK